MYALYNRVDIYILIIYICTHVQSSRRETREVLKDSTHVGMEHARCIVSEKN